MNFLLRKIAHAITDQIQRGSPVGAAVGCLCGLALGGGLGVLIWKTGGAPQAGPAIVVTLSILAALAGAMLGAALHRPKVVVPRSWDQLRPVRVANPTFGVSMLLLSFACMAVVWYGAVRASSDHTDERVPWLMTIALAAPAGIATAWLGSRQILWVVIADMVTVRRAFDSRTYPRDSIARWGLVFGDGERWNPDVVVVERPFFIEFTDGVTFEAMARPEKTAMIMG